jgi:hypothetical protein
MPKPIRILSTALAISLIVLFYCTGCASEKKNYLHSKKEASLCDLSRLGKNKYFYSATYQRKLSHSSKKIAKH